MKLLELVGDGRPSGGTTVVLALAADLARMSGWDVQVVSQTGSYAVERARQAGLTAHEVDFFRSRLNLGAIRSLTDLLRRESPSLVHAHGARAGFPLSFALPDAPAIPMVYTVHSYHFPGKSLLMRWLGALAERRCHRTASATTFVCRYDLDVARRWSLLPTPHLHRVVYNGIEPADFPDPAPEKDGAVVFFGNLIHQKHPELFVDMASRMKDPTLHFKMVGGGELTPLVRRMIDDHGLTDRFTLLGRVPRDQALAAVNGCRAMVMPSRWEGAPVVLLEAMHMRVPVVAAAVAGIPEFVVDGETGLLVTERTGTAYAEALRRLLSDDALRERVIEGGATMVRERFLRPTITQQYLSLYRELLQPEHSD